MKTNNTNTEYVTVIIHKGILYGTLDGKDYSVTSENSWELPNGIPRIVRIRMTSRKIFDRLFRLFDSILEKL